MLRKNITILGHTMLLTAENGTLTSCRWLSSIISENSDYSDYSDNSDSSDNSENSDNSDYISQTICEITEFIEGKRKNFTVPIEPRGTDFQMKVWDELRRIPYGETITYAELARRIGRPKAYRAVANACGANPLPIIIPCHRVISSSGHTGGYTGPVGIKESLIFIEKTKLPVKTF